MSGSVVPGRPRFSIITVCWNNLDGLRKTVESISSQDFADWEWIVVDGGSTDGTVAYLQSEPHQRLKWISEQDRGLYDAMNKGLDRVQGNFVLFLNSGDTLASRSTLSQIDSHMCGEDVGIAYGDAIETDGQNQWLKPARSHRRLWYGMFTHHQAIVYSRLAIKDLRYPLDLPIGGDYAFTSRASQQHTKFLRLGIPVCVFERGGVSYKREDQGRRDVWRVQSEILRIPWPLRAACRVIQVMSATARRRAPSLYAMVRFAKR